MVEDHAALSGAEFRLAQLGENVRNAAAGGLLDLGVGIAEGQAERGRQPPPDGRLARPHQAYERDRAPAQRLG